jgi:hypothetical protein
VTGSVDPGFSGGPVFYNGQLCGLVSGSLGDATMVVTLWPICLMEIEQPDLGQLNKKEVIGDWFQDGRLKAAEWPAIRERKMDKSKAATPASWAIARNNDHFSHWLRRRDISRRMPAKPICSSRVS